MGTISHDSSTDRVTDILDWLIFDYTWYCNHYSRSIIALPTLSTSGIFMKKLKRNFFMKKNLLHRTIFICSTNHNRIHLNAMDANF